MGYSVELEEGGGRGEGERGGDRGRQGETGDN